MTYFCEHLEHTTSKFKYMNKTIIASALLLAGIAGLTSCGSEKKSASVPAIDLTNMDTSVRPQDDFFHYVNGGWMAKNPLQPEYSRYGIFDKLANDNLEKTARHRQRCAENRTDRRYHPLQDRHALSAGYGPA